MLHRQADGKMPERSIKEITPEWLMENLLVNTIGPTMVLKHFGMKMTAPNKTEVDNGIATIATLSARVGSIGDNNLGGWASYRSAKAAQNSMTRTASLELKRKKVVVVALHPGTVDTDLSIPWQKGVKTLFTTDQCANYLLDVLEGLEIKDAGTFWDWEGKSIPW